MQRVRALCRHIAGGGASSPASATVAAATAAPNASNAEGYAELVQLFDDFRTELFNERRTDVAMDFNDDHVTSLPDFSADAMSVEFAKLPGFQKRLMCIDPGSWEIADQIDYHLVRAEMNGVEFRHKVSMISCCSCLACFFRCRHTSYSVAPGAQAVGD